MLFVVSVAGLWVGVSIQVFEFILFFATVVVFYVLVIGLVLLLLIFVLFLLVFVVLVVVLFGVAFFAVFVVFVVFVTVLWVALIIDIVDCESAQRPSPETVAVQQPKYMDVYFYVCIQHGEHAGSSAARPSNFFVEQVPHTPNNEGTVCALLRH